MIPFVISVYVEPKGFGSLFTTHATYTATLPQEKFGERCPVWFITSELGHTKISLRGRVKETQSYSTTPDLYVFSC